MLHKETGREAVSISAAGLNHAAILLGSCLFTGQSLFPLSPKVMISGESGNTPLHGEEAAEVTLALGSYVSWTPH